MSPVLLASDPSISAIPRRGPVPIRTQIRAYFQFARHPRRTPEIPARQLFFLEKRALQLFHSDHVSCHGHLVMTSELRGCGKLGITLRDEFLTPPRYYQVRIDAGPSGSLEWRNTVNEFGSNVDGHRRELLVHCYRMLGSLPDAEDAVQETLLRAWRYRDSLKEGAFWVTRYLRDPECPTQSPALRLRAAYGWNAWCGSFENTPLLLESAESESLQMLVANIRG